MRAIAIALCFATSLSAQARKPIIRKADAARGDRAEEGRARNDVSDAARRRRVVEGDVLRGAHRTRSGRPASSSCCRHIAAP